MIPPFYDFCLKSVKNLHFPKENHKNHINFPAQKSIRSLGLKGLIYYKKSEFKADSFMFLFLFLDKSNLAQGH